MLRPGLAPDSLPLAAEAKARHWALCSHAALLPPVALHRPVALPTVSDPEEVTLNGGVSAANGGDFEPS